MGERLCGEESADSGDGGECRATIGFRKIWRWFDVGENFMIDFDRNGLEVSMSNSTLWSYLKIFLLAECQNRKT